MSNKEAPLRKETLQDDIAMHEQLSPLKHLSNVGIYTIGDSS
jgi:hypothetical protein